MLLCQAGERLVSYSTWVRAGIRWLRQSARLSLQGRPPKVTEAGQRCVRTNVNTDERESE